MQKTTKMNSTYYFSRTKTSFIDVQIIIHYALRWFTGGVFTYVFLNIESLYSDSKKTQHSQ